MASRSIESVSPDDVWERDDGTKFIVVNSTRVPVCKHGDRLIAVFAPTLVATLCVTDLDKQQFEEFKQELRKVAPYIGVDEARVHAMIDQACLG